MIGVHFQICLSHHCRSKQRTNGDAETATTNFDPFLERKLENPTTYDLIFTNLNSVDHIIKN